jgi:hypothetical protein
MGSLNIASRPHDEYGDGQHAGKMGRLMKKSEKFIKCKVVGLRRPWAG